MNTINSVAQQISEKGQEVQKIAEEMATPYVEMASEKILKPVQETFQPQIDTATAAAAQVTEAAEQVRVRAAQVTETATATVQEGQKFINDRIEESQVDPTKDSYVAMGKAVGLTTLNWVQAKGPEYVYALANQLVTLMMALFAMCHDWLLSFPVYGQSAEQIKRAREGVDTSIYAEGTVQFYFQWSMLIVTFMSELGLTYVPEEYSQQVEETFNTVNEYVQPAKDRASVIVEDLSKAAEAPLKRVQETVQPAKERVEALVKQSVIGDIIEKGMSTINGATEEPSTKETLITEAAKVEAKATAGVKAAATKVNMAASDADSTVKAKVVDLKAKVTQ